MSLQQKYWKTYCSHLVTFGKQPWDLFIHWNYFWCYNGHIFVVNARKICVIWLKATKNACKSTGKFCCLYQLFLARIINVQSKTDSLLINAILLKSIFFPPHRIPDGLGCVCGWWQDYTDLSLISNCSVLQTKITVPCCQ